MATSLVERIRSLFRKNRASISPGESEFTHLLGAQTSSMGFGSFSTSSLKQVEQYVGWVRVCVKFLASQVGRMPVAARVTDRADRKAYQKSIERYYHKKSIGEYEPAPQRRRFMSYDVRCKSVIGDVDPHEEIEFLPNDHPLSRLLCDPNGPQTGYQFWPMALTYYYLTGRTYIWTPRDNTGIPQALWVLPSHWVNPLADPDSGRIRDYYEVRSQWISGSTKFGADDVIEFGDWHPMNPMLPDSPVAGAAYEIDTHAMVRMAQYLGLQNGADVGGIIELPADASMSDPNIQRWLASFQASAQGIYNFGKPQIMMNGAKYTPRDANRELAYLESNDRSRRNIMAHFGLDESLMGFSNESTHAAAAVNDKRLRYQIVKPMQEKLAGVLTERLARDFGDDIRIVFPESGGYEDPADRRANYQLAMGYPGSPAVTINEIRVNILGLEPLDGELADRGDELPKKNDAKWPEDEQMEQQQQQMQQMGAGGAPGDEQQGDAGADPLSAMIGAGAKQPQQPADDPMSAAIGQQKPEQETGV